ncbi:armadillo-type protein [Chlamydoabsidia padenii]|nr:armadillo-type protein [Chlamydoabsidia padenii]
MVDMNEELTHIRRELYLEIRIICDPLLKWNGPVTRTFSREAGSCMTNLLQLLEKVDDPEATIDAILIEAIVYPLLGLFKHSVQSPTRFDIIYQGLLQCLLFLLNNTLWSYTFTPEMMKQYLMLFINCLKQPERNNDTGNNTVGIYDKQATSSTITSGATEVIKLLAVSCISASLPISPSRKTSGSSSLGQQQRYNINLLPALLSEPFRYVIGQCITELLGTIRHDHDLALRLAALDTLHQLLFDNIQDSDELLHFMPGVTSTLCKVVWQKQEKEHHQVIAYSVDLIGDIIGATMDNRLNSEFIKHYDSLDDLKHIWLSMKQQSSQIDALERQQTKSMDQQHIESTETDQRQSGVKTKRTQAWYTQSKTALYNLMKGVLKISHHPNWNVRLAFVDLCYKLLINCWATVDNCIPLFIDTMVQLVDDSYPQVANTCKEHILQLKQTTNFETSLMPNLKEGLYSAILGLPRQLIAGDEQGNLYAMRRIIGYTYFLQHHAGTVFDASLDRISDGWLAALEIDKHSLNVLEEKQSARYIELGDTCDLLPTVTYPKLRFNHLVTTATADQAVHMLNVIGRYAPLKRWITHFMAYITVNNTSSLDDCLPQAAFMVHSLLAGATSTVDVDLVGDDSSGHDTLDLQKIGQRVLVDMSETLTVSTLGFNNNKASLAKKVDGSATADMEGNKVVTICLALQIVSLACGIIGKEATNDHLITLLYPILAHLGSTNVAIHTYALITLDNIALICGKRDGQQLAMDNMDYIINGVSQRISMLYDNPQAPLVLKAVVHVGGIATLDYLQDSVEEIFDALDRYHMHEGLCRQLCGVLFEIVQTAATSLPSATINKDTSNDGINHNKNSDLGTISPSIQEFIQQRQQWNSESTSNESPNTVDDIGQYFMEQRQSGKEDKDILELMAQTENAGKGLDNTPTNDSDNEEQQTDEPPPPLTNTQDLTLKIMIKAIHFLTSPSDQLRAQMLQLLCNGVRILATRTDKLDPVIHQVWPLVMNRLDDKTHYVAFYAAELVQVLSETRGDFISGRFADDVWPRFKGLVIQAAAHMATSSTPIYSTFSFPHRLQRCLLDTLIRAAKYIPLKQQIALDLVESTTWLLSQHRVHHELQSLTIQLYLALYPHHPDTIWLHVFGLSESPTLQPMSEMAMDIRLDPLVVPDWMAAQNKEYYENANKILSSMDRILIIH